MRPCCFRKIRFSATIHAKYGQQKNSATDNMLLLLGAKSRVVVWKVFFCVNSVHYRCHKSCFVKERLRKSVDSYTVKGDLFINENPHRLKCALLHTNFWMKCELEHRMWKWLQIYVEKEPLVVSWEVCVIGVRLKERDAHRTHTHTHTHARIHTYIHTHIKCTFENLCDVIGPTKKHLLTQATASKRVISLLACCFNCSKLCDALCMRTNTVSSEKPTNRPTE